jgi:uncharacterized protein (TIGR03435 family)
MPGSSRYILIAAFAGAALCQEFEVASVKPNKSSSYRSSFTTDRGRVMATNVSLKGLIMRAYRVQDYQVDGPDWLSSERFDVSATFPETRSQDHEPYDTALENMMQKMLADRFQLAVHRERKVRAVYELMAGKSGIHVQEAHGSDCDSHSRNSSGTHFAGRCISMGAFADFLARRRRDLPVDLPVLDMTGIQGFYNLTLDWVPDAAGDNPSGATLPVALQEQLGLKLQMGKAPIEILVVDKAERTPTEN